MDYLVYASLFGGVLTLVLIQFRKLPLPAPLARQTWILRLHESGRRRTLRHCARRRRAHCLSENRLDAGLRHLILR